MTPSELYHGIGTKFQSNQGPIADFSLEKKTNYEMLLSQAKIF